MAIVCWSSGVLAWRPDERRSVHFDAHPDAPPPHHLDTDITASTDVTASTEES